MKIKFNSILALTLFLLVTAFFFQIFWIRAYYIDQSSKLELNILSAMRTANDLLINQKGRQTNASDLENIDFPIYNDLLQVELMQRDLIFDSYTEMLDLKQDRVVGSIPDRISTANKSGYKSYSYSLDLEETYAYRLNVRYPDLFLLEQMSGVLITSLLMILALISSYIYLLKIIYKQKTLDEIKSDFVSNMTHELKTPISIAYAATDALLNYGMMDDSDKMKSYLHASKKQLEHLSGLVEQILTMSVEERKNLQMKLSNIGLFDLFHQMKQQYLLNAAKDIEIRVEVIPSDLLVQADIVHFQNAISNLIENSIKYSGKQVTIILKAQAKQDKIEIEIADNGNGIPSESLSKIFDRFYRVPTGDIHDVKGHGLGLYYVKTIVEKHHWTIDVKSKEGEGAKFIIVVL